MSCPSMGADLFLIYQMVVYRGLVTAMIFMEGNQETQLHKAGHKIRRHSFVRQEINQEEWLLKAGDITAYQPSYT
jgi:hypothetical protein